MSWIVRRAQKSKFASCDEASVQQAAEDLFNPLGNWKMVGLGTFVERRILQVGEGFVVVRVAGNHDPTSTFIRCGHY